MHGLAAVPQSLHGESFWIARLLGPFGPSVAVAMKCHAFDAEFGDRTKALVEGIQQDRGTVIPDGATVRLETAANTKA